MSRKWSLFILFLMFSLVLAACSASVSAPEAGSACS